MKVKELIAKLQKQDPEKEVQIEQGGDTPYMDALSVKSDIKVVVIEYQY